MTSMLHSGYDSICSVFSCVCKFSAYSTDLAAERHIQLLRRGGCAGLQDIGTCAPEGKHMYLACSHICSFASRGDDRNAPVTLSLKTASKGGDNSPFTDMSHKCLLCKDDRWVWKYSMVHHRRTDYAVAVAVGSKDFVASAFCAKYDASEW